VGNKTDWALESGDVFRLRKQNAGTCDYCSSLATNLEKAKLHCRGLLAPCSLEADLDNPADLRFPTFANEHTGNLARAVRQSTVSSSLAIISCQLRKLLQKSHIILKKHLDVIDAVLEHR
jgi:hypothetical protein